MRSRIVLACAGAGGAPNGHIADELAITRNTVKKWRNRFAADRLEGLNLVERGFGELATKNLQRGTHRSGRALNQDPRTWIEPWNDDPRPYIWTKSPATAHALTTHHAR